MPKNKSKANKPRLKYEDSSDVPAEAVVHRDGRRRFVIGAGGAEVEVLTASTLSQRRLKYKDGSVVPTEAVVHQVGLKRFVRGADGTPVEVLAASNFSKRRLKYKGGSVVPTEAVVQEVGQQRFVIGADGTPVEVFMAGTLCQRRFKYEDNSDVPAGVDVHQLGARRWVVRKVDGSTVRVFRAGTLSQRRFKYEDKRDVPAEVDVHRVGREWFAKGVDGTKVQVFRAATLRLRLRRSCLKDSAVLSEAESEEDDACAAGAPADHLEEGSIAGISNKYLEGGVPRLPKRGGEAVSESVLERFPSHLELVRLREAIVGEQSGVACEVPIELSGEGCVLKFHLYTFKPAMVATDKLIFIFSGRKEDAYIPQIAHRDASSVRVILVGPREDFELLEAHLQPGIDFLVLDEIASLTHGRYERLGLLNTRRIGAFCFGLYAQARYGIEHALMLDDNIRSVHCGALGMDSWEGCFEMLAEQARGRHAACVSLATISNNGTRQQRAGELGSKFYLFDLAMLHSALGEARSNWMIPFFPASANAFWGEDYYFQLLFQSLFAGKGQRGYMVLDVMEYGLRRASLPSLCRKVVKTADVLCRVSMEDLFGEGLSGLSPASRRHIEQTVGKLQAIIDENVRLHADLLRRSKTKDLMMAHAWANRLVYKEDARLAVMDEEAFLGALAKQLLWVAEQGLLHGYQRDLLKDVAGRLDRARFLGQINMATGTGKTYVQIYLAIAALLTGTRRPVVMVTPYRHLVKQAYDDFLQVLESFPESPIAATRVLKVDSEVSSIAAETLLRNPTLDGKPCVLIFCQDSYLTVRQSEEARMRDYQYPCMLLLDEAHLQSAVLESLNASHAQAQHCFIAGLTATPKAGQALWSLEESALITYPRSVAVHQDYLAPCILDRIAEDYSREGALAVIKNMPHFLNRLFPSGGRLLEKKGIIYVPNNEGEVNYSKQLKDVLALEGIRCFEINASEPDSRANLEAFKHYHEEDGPRILICKGMTKVGFSDSNVHWIVYLQKGDAAQFAQSAGRTMRILPYAKVGYVLAFRDVQAGLVFEEGRTADEKALTRCTEAYRLQRTETGGMIAIDASQSVGCGIDERMSDDVVMGESEAEEDEYELEGGGLRGGKRKPAARGVGFFANTPKEKRTCLPSDECSLYVFQ